MTKMNDLKLGTPALDRMPPIPDDQMSGEQKELWMKLQQDREAELEVPSFR